MSRSSLGSPRPRGKARGLVCGGVVSGNDFLRATVGEVEAGLRLDQAVARMFDGVSRARAQRLVSADLIRRFDTDGRRRPARKGDSVMQGDVLEIRKRDTLAAEARPDPNLSLDVVLCTDQVVVVDKAPGMPSAPRGSSELGCVANGLVAQFEAMRNVGYGPLEPGLCHRLDNDTSGLLLAARTVEAFDELTEAIRQGALEKTYDLVCRDHSALGDSGVIDAPIAPHPSDSRRVVTLTGQPGLKGEAGGGRPEPSTGLCGVPVTGLGRGSCCEGRTPSNPFPLCRHRLPTRWRPFTGEKVNHLNRHALHARRIRWRGGQVPAFDVQRDFSSKYWRRTRCVLNLQMRHRGLRRCATSEVNDMMTDRSRKIFRCPIDTQHL